MVAQYQFDDSVYRCARPSPTCSPKGKDLYRQLNGRYADKDLVKYVDVGMTYYFNKNMSTYVDYKINLLDEDRATSTAQTASPPMTLSRWVWSTSSKIPS